MFINRLFFVLLMISLLSACADFSGRQPPAPVFGDTYGNNVHKRYPQFPNEQPSPPPPVIETKPLGGLGKAPDMIEIKPEFPLPAENPPIQPETEHNSSPEDASADPALNEQPSEDPEAQETEAVIPQAPPLPDFPKEPETLQPLETFAPQSPAVGSLLMAANENSQSGNADSAISSIERAIRIEPRNATLYYKLAVLRLKQSKPRLAEDLARKAALLAVNDNTLKKHSWLLIANARELQNNKDGAKQAKAEAGKY